MPACFLTKMAAIGKDDGSEIERNKTEKKRTKKTKQKLKVYINGGIVCLIVLLHTQYLLTLYTHTLSIHSGSTGVSFSYQHHRISYVQQM